MGVRKETNPTSGSKAYRQEPLKQSDLPSLLLLHRDVEDLRQGLLPTAKVWGREKLYTGMGLMCSVGRVCYLAVTQQEELQLEQRRCLTV